MIFWMMMPMRVTWQKQQMERFWGFRVVLIANHGQYYFNVFVLAYLFQDVIELKEECGARLLCHMQNRVSSMMKVCSFFVF